MFPTTYRTKEICKIPSVSSQRYGINSLSFRGSLLWNALSDDLKFTTSLLNFKKEIRCWDGNNCTHVLHLHNILLSCIYQLRIYQQGSRKNCTNNANLKLHILTTFEVHCSHLQMSCPNTAITKNMLFAKPTRRYYRDDWLKIGELLGVTPEQAKRTIQARGEFAELVHHRFSSTP